MEVGNAEQSGPVNHGARGAQRPDLLSKLRVAIVHYWFVRFRGGGRVVEALGDMSPRADVFTLVLDPKALPPSLRSCRFTISFLQRIPGIRRHYKRFLFLFPLPQEQFKLDEYDLVIGSESSTGVFFAEPSARPLAEATRFFEPNETRISPASVRCHAERFDVSRFKSEMGSFVNLKMLEFKNRKLGDY
jgi:hypothetical protein